MSRPTKFLREVLDLIEEEGGTVVERTRTKKRWRITYTMDGQPATLSVSDQPAGCPHRLQNIRADIRNNPRRNHVQHQP